MGGFWDPLGLSEGNADIAKYRRAELKHGRVCMLAALGIILSERFHPFFDQWGDGEFVSAVASHFSATAGKNFWPAFWSLRKSRVNTFSFRSSSMSITRSMR